MCFLTVLQGDAELAGLDDARLMVAVRQGDPMAFRILVERYKKRAYYVALRLVGDSEDAWDLSQEAFIRVYNARSRYDSGRPFYTWFYSILSNLAKNHLKKRAVRAEYAARESRAGGERLNADARRGPDLLLEADETRHAVWKAIELLSYEQREIIILRHFEDMSYEEIAKLLDIPVGSVMSRLYYARRRLRELLGESNDG